MTGGEILTSLAAVVLGGGFLSGIVALVKLKPEGAQILVSSAKDVVLIQQGALDDLREQMGELEKRLGAQLGVANEAREAAESALRECRNEAGRVAAEHEKERARNEALTARVAALEAEIADLRGARDG